MKNKKSMVIHPFLFAIFPVLFLYSRNIGEVFVKWTLVPAGITLVSTVLLWLVLVFLCKEKNRAGLLLSLFLAYFFSYGHFVGTLRNFWTAAQKFGSQTWLFPIWTAAFLVAAYFAFKIRRHTINLTKIMNVIAFCLIGLSLINIATFQIKAVILRQDNTDMENVEKFPTASNAPASLPNIYYLIFDEHLGSDVLEESFGYDNSRFLDQLVQRGFFVANKSRANYVKTALSLPSSLNFKYLDDLANQVGVKSRDKRPLRKLLVNNRVFSFLKQYGYTTVAFPTGFHLTELRDADRYMSRGWSLDDFSSELVNNTPVVALIEVFSNQWFKHICHRRRVLYVLDYLVDATKMKTPVFVFAHIACPHSPYVFDEEGRMPPADVLFSRGGIKGKGRVFEQFNQGYLPQLKYLDKKIIEVVDDILANSAHQPIIILQADHGTRWLLDWEYSEKNDSEIYKRAFSILNAYYLPGFDYSHLHDSVSPVNTFRHVFNHYFETDYEILEDKSYFSGLQHYNFIDVTEEVNK